MGLMEERPVAEYNTSEQDLYIGLNMVWTSYEEHLVAFTDWKTTYTATVGTDQLLALKTAKKMASEAQRDELHSSISEELGPLSEECLICWKQLESYIRDAFSPAVFDGKLNAAGYGFYTAASARNWASVDGLMNDGHEFITDNTAALDTAGMPATFAASFTMAKDNFGLRYTEFLQAEETSKVLRDQKIEANNNLYKVAMAMCEDGKKIFRKTPAVRDQFTWSTVQRLISNAQVAHSVRGLVLIAGSETPIEDALVKVAALGSGSDSGTSLEWIEVESDDTGFYKVIGLYNGDYRMVVEAAGFADFSADFTIEDGALVLDVELVPDEE